MKLFAEPLWTDPGLESGNIAGELSPLKPQKKRRLGMILASLLHTKKKNQHRHYQILIVVWMDGWAERLID